MASSITVFAQCLVEWEGRRNTTTYFTLKCMRIFCLARSNLLRLICPKTTVSSLSAYQRNRKKFKKIKIIGWLFIFFCRWLMPSRFRREPTSTDYFVRQSVWSYVCPLCQVSSLSVYCYYLFICKLYWMQNFVYKFLARQEILKAHVYIIIFRFEASL